MLTGYEFLEAAYMAKMISGGGSTTTETMFDRISKLPTVFAFDIADGWRCELCADNAPIECPHTVAIRIDSWSEEYTSTVCMFKKTKTFYLRIFNGSDLKMATDPSQADSITKLYESDGTNIGELKKTVITEYSDFSVYSVSSYYADWLGLPTISLIFKKTITTNGAIETSNAAYGYISSSIKFFASGEIDPNTYVEFVKDVRKMSDEYNKTKEE